MANSTDPFAQTIHGTNPQYLIEKITRLKIYNAPYWKEECFGLTAATILDKAAALKYCGGLYGGNLLPGKFLCLLLKLLQLQPEKEVVYAYIQQEDFKYLRALGAFYLRLTGRAQEVYTILEPIYNDFRKLAYRGMDGWRVIYMDDLVDQLLHEELVCDIALPHMAKRDKLEGLGALKPRVSALEGELLEMEEMEALAMLQGQEQGQDEDEQEEDGQEDEDGGMAVAFDDEDEDEPVSKPSAPVPVPVPAVHAPAAPAVAPASVAREQDHSKDKGHKDKEAEHRRAERRERSPSSDYGRDRDRGHSSKQRDHSRDRNRDRDRDRDRRDSRDRRDHRDRDRRRDSRDRHRRSPSPHKRRRSPSYDSDADRNRDKDRHRSKRRDSRDRDRDSRDRKDVKGKPQPVEVIPQDKPEEPKKKMSDKAFDRIFGKKSGAVASSQGKATGKTITNSKGEKVTITAAEGTVEYWNQIRESLGMSKLK